MTPGMRRIGVLVGISLAVAGCSSTDDDPAPDDGSTCDDVFFLAATADNLTPSYDVYTYAERGGRTGRLTDDHMSLEAVLSPDGTRMVVVSGQGHRHIADQGYEGASLYVSDVGGGSRLRLTDGGAGPSWSPDGSEVAFIYDVDRQGADDPEQVLVVDPDDPRKTTVVARPDSGAVETMWLDDDTVAWLEPRDRSNTVVSRDAAGEGPTSVVATDVPFDAVWSPDHTRIAFSAGPYGERRLVVRYLDSGQVTDVADSVSNDTTAVAWTKDDRLFFVRNAAGPSNSIKVAEDGGRGPVSVVGTTPADESFAGFDSINPACG